MCNIPDSRDCSFDFSHRCWRVGVRFCLFLRVLACKLLFFVPLRHYRDLDSRCPRVHLPLLVLHVFAPMAFFGRSLYRSRYVHVCFEKIKILYPTSQWFQNPEPRVKHCKSSGTCLSRYCSKQGVFCRSWALGGSVRSRRP